MRSPGVAFTFIMLVAVAAATPASAVLPHVEALPLMKVWTRSVDGAPPKAAAAGSTHLVAGFADHLDAFSLDTGDKDWTLPVAASRVACDGAFCVVSDEASLSGIDLNLRAQRWGVTLDAPLSAAPTLRSGWVLISTTTGSVRALQAADGRQVWSYEAGSAVIGAPSINGAEVAISTAAKTIALINLPDGHLVWTADLDNLPGPPRLGGGRVLVGTENGRLLTLDAANGRVRFDQRTGGNVTGMPALDDDHIYTVGLDGVLRAFDRGNGAQRWYKDLDTRALSGPVVDGNLVFVALRTGAVDIRLSDGGAAAHLPAPSAETTLRLAVPPVIAGQGGALMVLTLSYDLNDTGKWSLAGYRGGAAIATSGWPAQIPGRALTLTAPR